HVGDGRERGSGALALAARLIGRAIVVAAIDAAKCQIMENQEPVGAGQFRAAALFAVNELVAHVTLRITCIVAVTPSCDSSFQLLRRNSRAVASAISSSEKRPSGRNQRPVQFTAPMINSRTSRGSPGKWPSRLSSSITGCQ